MTPLEQRYRRALRWYPGSWRRANEDAIVGTLLDGAEGRDAPRPGEVANLALNGLFARFGWVGKVVPASVRDRASTVALGFGFGVTVVMLVMQEWAPWAAPVAYVPQPALSIGPFHGWGGVLYSVWAVAFIAAVAGLRTVARWLLAVTVPFYLVLAFILQTSWWLRPSSLGLVILLLLALVVIMGDPVAARIRYLPLAGATIFGAAWVLVPFVRNIEPTELIPPWQIWTMTFGSGTQSGNLGLIIVALGVIATIARRGQWVGAFFVLGLAWLAIAILYLPTDGVVAAVAAVIVALALITWLRASGYRLALVRRE